MSQRRLQPECVRSDRIDNVCVSKSGNISVLRTLSLRLESNIIWMICADPMTRLIADEDVDTGDQCRSEFKKTQCDGEQDSRGGPEMLELNST